jgi:hypothetical protein
MKGAKSQTQTTTVDPQTQAYVNQMRQQALGYQGGGGYVDPRIAQMSQNYSNAGNLGIGALTGTGPNAFMNPYLSQMDPYFAQQRAQAVGGANDQATLAGAFGGDRSQIGAATAGNLADQNAAQFRFQAFNDAQQRALQAANLGYGAAFMPQQYQQGQLGLLNQGLGPYGSKQFTKMKGGDWLSGLLGAGLSIAGLFGGHGGGGSGDFSANSPGILGAPGSV